MKKIKMLLALGAIALWGQQTFAHGGAEARVVIEPAVTTMMAGSNQYTFQLVDTVSNKTIGDVDLNISHEKKLHFIVYDPSLQEFQHVHPEFDGTNWNVAVKFAVNGNYWVWTQGELTSDGTEFSASTRLDVTMRKPALPAPPVLGDYRTGSDGTSAAEIGKTKIVAGKMVMLDLKMSRTDGSTPKLTPYLGAFAHIIATPADGDELIHVHPMGTSATHGMIHASFPTPGDYRLWIQFLDDGNLKTIPLSVTVY